MLTLLHANHSTCSQKVRICLAEKGLDYESRLIDLPALEHLESEYLKLNPNGVVPTLIHDDTVVLDSSVMCEYLDEVFPEPRQTPADPGERARMRAWMRYIEEVPTTAVRYPSFNMAFLTRYEGLDDQGFLDEQADIRPLRKGFFRRMTRQGFSEAEIQESFERIAQTAQRMDAALAAGPWIMGEAYTLADIVVAPLFDRMADLGFAHLWENDFPRFTDWFARIQARPAFRAAFYPGSRLTEFLDIAPWSRTERMAAESHRDA